MAKEKPDKDPAPASPAPAAPLSGQGYQTLDGNEALSYIEAGGRLVSVTKQFPKHPFKAGKRYVFLESKAALDQLMAKSQEVG